MQTPTECVIAVRTTKAGTPRKDGGSIRYAKIKAGASSVRYVEKPAAASIYPNETWARKDIDRLGLPKFATIEPHRPT